MAFQCKCLTSKSDWLIFDIQNFITGIHWKVVVKVLKKKKKKSKRSCISLTFFIFCPDGLFLSPRETKLDTSTGGTETQKHFVLSWQVGFICASSMTVFYMMHKLTSQLWNAHSLCSQDWKSQNQIGIRCSFWSKNDLWQSLERGLND